MQKKNILPHCDLSLICCCCFFLNTTADVVRMWSRVKGGFCSQVSLRFEEGIPPKPWRKKIMNTFAVAMPTGSLSHCSQLCAFQFHRALRNYPQYISTPIWERDWGMGHRQAVAFICIFSVVRRCIGSKGRARCQRVTGSHIMTFALLIWTSSSTLSLSSLPVFPFSPPTHYYIHSAIFSSQIRQNDSWRLSISTIISLT